jgi:hypothetical protein
MEKFIYSVKEYQTIQAHAYTVYCGKCRANGIDPEKQERYFPVPDQNYGYVYPTVDGWVWRRTKKQLLAYMS